MTCGEAELGLLSYPKKWPELTVRTWREEAMVLVVDPVPPAGEPDERSGVRA